MGSDGHGEVNTEFLYTVPKHRLKLVPERVERNARGAIRGPPKMVNTCPNEVNTINKVSK